MTIEPLTREAYEWLRLAGYAGTRGELARPDWWPAEHWALLPVAGKPHSRAGRGGEHLVSGIEAVPEADVATGSPLSP